MKITPAPQVLGLEVYDGGAKITFDDECCAIYPAGLLYASRNLAKIMSEAVCDPNDDSRGPLSQSQGEGISVATQKS